MSKDSTRYLFIPTACTVMRRHQNANKKGKNIQHATGRFTRRCSQLTSPQVKHNTSIVMSAKLLIPQSIHLNAKGETNKYKDTDPFFFLTYAL